MSTSEFAKIVLVMCGVSGIALSVIPIDRMNEASQERLIHWWAIIAGVASWFSVMSVAVGIGSMTFAVARTHALAIVLLGLLFGVIVAITYTLSARWLRR